MKIKRKLSIFLSLILMLSSFQVCAATKEVNAFKKQLPSIYSQIKKDSYLPYTTVKYTFIDLNNDGMKEMIAYDSYNPYSKGYIYQYKKGKVSRVNTKCNFQPSRKISSLDIYSYKAKKVFKTGVVSEQSSATYYYQYKKGRYVLVAESGTDYVDETITYYKVSGKKVSKAKYNNFVKKLVKSTKARKVSTGKWYQY